MFAIVGEHYVVRRQMSIQDIGSIGEMVAAIATIATLLYLAIQIRVSSNASTAEAERQVSRDWTDSVTDIWRDRATVKVMVQGLKHGVTSLDEDDAMLFTARLANLISQQYSAQMMHEKGLLNDEFRKATLDTISMFLSSDGGKAWWENMKHLFPNAEIIDEAIEKADVPGFSEWHSAVTGGTERRLT